MQTKYYEPTFVIGGRLPKGADLLESLSDICIKQEVTVGTVMVIGAVNRAVFSYYDQATKSYIDHPPIEEGMEIVSATGNISLKNGVPFVHMHVIYSGADGKCVGGHLISGARVFSCEYFITLMKGLRLERVFDEETGLHLWKE